MLFRQLLDKESSTYTYLIADIQSAKPSSSIPSLSR